MPYPEQLVAPMRQELVRTGFRELRTAAQVDEVLGSSPEPVLIVVNSVCGCAAGSLRPAVALSLAGEVAPPVLATVFAGQDLEATGRAREYFTGYPPSSPCVAIVKDGELLWMLERHQIERRPPQVIAEELLKAYLMYCDAAPRA